VQAGRSDGSSRGKALRGLVSALKHRPSKPVALFPRRLLGQRNSGGVPGAQRTAWVGDYCPTLEKVKLAASTVLCLAGFCPRCGAPAPQIHGRGAGGVAGGVGNDASCGVDGKAGPDCSGPWVAISFR
jgi:hypothetical protein